MSATGRTTLGVQTETKEQFERVKPFESMSADEFVRVLLEEYEGRSA